MGIDLVSNTTTLTFEESKELEKNELIIQTGIQTFYEVGKALLEIKEKQLYKENFQTFEDYLQIKWNITKTHGNRLIQSFNVVNNLTPIGVLPKTEGQARELTGLEPEFQRFIMSKITEIAEPITAKIIKEYVEKFKPINEEIKDIKKESPGISETDLLQKAENKYIVALKAKEERIQLLEKELKDKNNDTELFDYRKKINEYQILISDLQKKLEENNQLSLSGIEKYKTETENLSAELKQKNQELQKLKKLEADKERVEKTLAQIQELEKKKSSLFEDSKELERFAECHSKAIDFFNKNIHYLPAVNLKFETKQTIQKEVNEIITTVENWLYFMKEKFLVKEVINHG